jgi:hypothetical protein
MPLRAVRVESPGHIDRGPRPGRPALRSRGAGQAPSWRARCRSGHRCMQWCPTPGSRAHGFLTRLGFLTTPSPAAAREVSPSANVPFPEQPKGRHSDRCFRRLNTLPASPGPPARTAFARTGVENPRLGFAVGLMGRFIPALSVPDSPPALFRQMGVWLRWQSVNRKRRSRAVRKDNPAHSRAWRIELPEWREISVFF